MRFKTRAKEAWAVLRHGPRDDTEIIQRLFDLGGVLPPGRWYVTEPTRLGPTTALDGGAEITRVDGG